MHIVLQRLTIHDPRLDIAASTDKAVLSFDGADHDLLGWEADVYLPAGEHNGFGHPDYPLEIRMETNDGYHYLGLARIRHRAVNGPELYLCLAGYNRLVDDRGNPF